LASNTFPRTRRKPRGRSERLNRTFQDRLVNELRVAAITTLGPANRYLHDRFVPQHNATFSRPPRDAASALFRWAAPTSIRFSVTKGKRVVATDNTVSFEGRCLQRRGSVVGARVPGAGDVVRAISTGSNSIWRGPRRLARYLALERLRDSRTAGPPMEAAAPWTPRRAHRALDNAQNAFPTSSHSLSDIKRPDHLSTERTDHLSTHFSGRQRVSENRANGARRHTAPRDQDEAQ